MIQLNKERITELKELFSTQVATKREWFITNKVKTALVIAVLVILSYSVTSVYQRVTNYMEYINRIEEISNTMEKYDTRITNISELQKDLQKTIKTQKSEIRKLKSSRQEAKKAVKSTDDKIKLLKKRKLSMIEAGEQWDRYE